MGATCAIEMAACPAEYFSYCHVWDDFRSIWAKKNMFSLELGRRFSVDLGWKNHVFVRTRQAIFGRFGLKKSCFRSNSAGDYRSIWVGKIMFSLEPVQFFTHFQFSSVFYSFPIQFGFLFISNSVQLNWKWTELEMSWIGNECCVTTKVRVSAHRVGGAAAPAQF